ncbi:MAG: DUF4340 domain-containing protein [Verrucomicrobiales bacterium]
MSTRQVIILWITAIVFVGLFTIMKVNQSHETKSNTARSSGQTLLEAFPANDVTKVTITSANGTVTLVRIDKKWTVQEREGYPANNSNVNALIRTVAELKIVEGVEAGPSYAPRFGMDEASSAAKDRGYTIAFTDAAGKELAKVSIGKSFGGKADGEADPMAGPGGGATGRFIRNHGDETGIYKTSELFGSLVGKPTEWLTQEFVNVEKPKSISITKPGKEELEWKLTRADENANFALDGAPAEGLDEPSTTALKGVFSYGRFDDVVTGGELAKRDQADKKQLVNIETVEGFKYAFTIAPAKPGDAKPASADGPPPASDTYFVTVDVTAQLATERKKEADEKPEDAKTKDEAFATRLKALQQQLEIEQKLRGRTYEVAKSAVEPLLKDKAALLKKADAPAPAGGPQGTTQGQPPGLGGLPGLPDGPRRAPVEAVTPPISVPGPDGQ